MPLIPLLLAVPILGTAACAPQGKAKSPADQVLDRYSTFRRTCPAVALHFTVSIGKQDLPGEGVVDHRARLFMAYKTKGLDYLCTITPKTYLEVDNTQKLYEESDGVPHVMIGDSHLTSANQYFPIWYISDDLTKMVPSAAKRSLEAKETVNGASCDRVKVEIGGEQPQNLEFSIDGKGMLRKVVQTPLGMGAGSAITWIVASATAMTPSDEAKFGLKVPLGYVPYSVPTVHGPIEVGNAFPMSGWASNTGSALDLKKTLGPKGGLIVIEDESEVSQRASSTLDHFKGMPMVVLGTGTKPLGGTQGYDPKGTTLKAISAPGYPLFAMVDGSGKITKLWMGFDPDAAGTFEAEVRDAFAGK